MSSCFFLCLIDLKLTFEICYQEKQEMEHSRLWLTLVASKEMRYPSYDVINRDPISIYKAVVLNLGYASVDENGFLSFIRHKVYNF